MPSFSSLPLLRTAAFCGVAALAGCTEPLDFDLRGNLGGFSTTDAVQNGNAAPRSTPDERGIISYPSYQVAVARRGDSVETVANRVGLDAAELARFNGMTPEMIMREGEVLALPRRVPESTSQVDIEALAGAAIDAAPDTPPRVETTTLAPVEPATQPGPEPVRHKVERGETAYTIARLYQVSVKDLAEWNGLGSDFALREGQYLLIPVGAAAAPAATASSSAVSAPGEGSTTPQPPSSSTPLPDEVVAAAEAPAAASVGEPTATRSNAQMSFPVKGKIIREYAKGKNDGIDIAAAAGSAVTAADDGTVAAITTDANKVPIVVVRHANNLLTVYANVDDIRVQKGDSVRRGSRIASLRDGDSAYVHFEVRDGFDSVDPMPYLE